MGKPEGPWWNLVSSHVLIQGQWNVKWTIWTNWCGFPGVFIPGVFGEVGTLFSSPEAVQRAGLGSGSGVWGSNNWTLVCRVARSSARLHLKTCAKHLKRTQKIHILKRNSQPLHGKKVHRGVHAFLICSLRLLIITAIIRTIMSCYFLFRGSWERGFWCIPTFFTTRYRHLLGWSAHVFLVFWCGRRHFPKRCLRESKG